jgi:Na+-transporting methylmalonyl-CoA/oxaloacetate decarboxylase gamma subunit
MLQGIDWDLVAKVCIYGQLAVFIVLTILMLSVYTTSAIIKQFLNSNINSNSKSI